MIAPELGWNASDATASVESYRADVVHERESAGLPETHLDALLGA